MDDHDDTYIIRQGVIYDEHTGERLGVHDKDGEPFDAAGHMRKIRTRQGMQDYLDVKWRIAWFNSLHMSTGSIVTEQLEADEQHARFKATVTIAAADGVQMYTGHGSETMQDFPDFYEKAETKAIGRALAVAGFGTEMAADLDDGEPMDGRAAAKDERAERRETAPAPQGEPQSPTPHKRPDVQGNGLPRPTREQMAILKDEGARRGMQITDAMTWLEVADYVASMRAGKPTTWQGEKRPARVIEALKELPVA